MRMKLNGIPWLAPGSVVVAVAVTTPAQSDTFRCEWIPLGGGVSGITFAMTNFDEGNGLHLYAGGGFVSADGAYVNHVARWDGQTWSALGTGMNGPVHALVVFDDGSGQRLYAGGYFSSAGGIEARGIASWDGNQWHAVGGGVASGGILAMTVADLGDGAALYVGGGFEEIGGTAANRVAKWDGQQWSPLGSGIGNSAVSAVTSYRRAIDQEAALVVGGNFTVAGGLPIARIAEWDGTSWASLSAAGGANQVVHSLAVADLGDGASLFAGGEFTSVGGTSANRIARWDGTAWSALGTGVSAGVRAIVSLDEGYGTVLYAGGWFNSAGGVTARRVARWDGRSWSPLGSGGGLNWAVYSLVALEAASGMMAVVGGDFTATSDGAIPCNRIVQVPCWSDCNANGVADHTEVNSGAAADCNGNGVPDSCEISVSLGPMYEAPFDGAHPLSAWLHDVPTATGSVEIEVNARAELGAPSQFVTLKLNGSVAATLFANDGASCGKGDQSRAITIDSMVFNQICHDGSLQVEVIASGSVTACAQSQLSVTISFEAAPDCDANGVWDQCQIGRDEFQDCDENEILDVCEGAVLDCDGDGERDACQIRQRPALDLNADGVLDACSMAVGDFDLSGVIDGADLGLLLSVWGASSPGIGDLNMDGFVNGADLSMLLGSWGVVVFH